jgi:uncharacterized coiled-coil DUF342 family protein
MSQRKIANNMQASKSQRVFDLNKEVVKISKQIDELENAYKIAQARLAQISKEIQDLIK